MKTAKQWIDESNWSDELKELFWERVEGSYGKEVFRSLEEAVGYGFIWGNAPEGEYFWKEVAEGKRTDIDRVQNTDREYETLVRKMLEGLKEEEVGSTDDAFTRGFNAGIREMNAKIDDLLKKL